eukprot:TRINITY_DN187_c0_g1_i1.p1 TRINITY_DN187_c0_g1~~TRINITY_DN187_c0_g1_i1.p1  ORF type:complete len:515 (+),score=81.41 TRINITY_DN187_c0_g1_i1:167-1711(+)
MANPRIGLLAAAAVMVLAVFLPTATARFGLWPFRKIFALMEVDTKHICLGTDQIVTYRVTVKNCGPGELGEIRAELPPKSVVVGTDGGPTCTFGANLVQCIAVQFPPGPYPTCSYTSFRIFVKVDLLGPTGPFPLPLSHPSRVKVKTTWCHEASDGNCGFTAADCGHACPVFDDGNPCTHCYDDQLTMPGGFVASVPTIKPMLKVESRSRCCEICKTEPDCAYYTFDPECDECKLYGSDVCAKGVGFSNPTKTIVTGGPCNPKISDDPHFIGAHGVKYDFNGVPKETFCLITDKLIHINMRLSGYYANETIRSWIRELVFFWRVEDVKHTLQIIARSGKGVERSDGFVESIILDGVTLPRMQPKDSFDDAASGLNIKMKAVTKLGPYEVDSYHVSINERLEADIKSRVAHKLLQLPDDAETHLNLRVISIAYTDDVHGVLGQTYRNDRTERTERFQKIVDSLNAPIHADGKDGEGFLDGSLKDYETHDPLSTACTYDRFASLTSEVALPDSMTK